MITVLLLSPALDVTYLVASAAIGEIHRPRDVVRLAGGKGLNLARAATTLGAEVQVIAPLGGEIGSLVAALAAEEGIALSPIWVTAMTRSCITIAAADSRELTEFYEPAAPVSGAEVIALGAAMRGKTRQGDGGWTVLSGSVPRDVDTSALVETLRARATAGDRIALDTHGPVLGVLVDSLRPHLVKVNRFEASELLGVAHDRPAIELARGLRERSGATVIVTDGTAGSVAVDSAGAWRAQLDAAPGLFSVGSGDSYLAGILCALERGDSLRDALAIATGAAAANAEIPGAGSLDGALALSLAERTRVTALAE
jgi:1-phosphofructokinase family hexose kinase